MIVIYAPVPNAQIKKETKDAIKDITAWFEANPKKRICKAQVWYGKIAKVRRNHVKEDLEAAAFEAMK